MARRARNPVNGRGKRKRGVKPCQSSDDEGLSSTSDSDFVVGIDESEEDEDDDVEEAAAPPPPPPPIMMYRRRGRAERKRRRGDDEPPLIWEAWAEENSKWIDEFELGRGGGSSKQSAVEIVDPAPDILLPLLRFQKEWLAWALKQEESNIRGGILADEMGMGKTIQAISLVLTSRYLRSESIGVVASSDLPSTSSSSLPRTKCTLVICPVVAVIQWVGEIERYTEKGSARVLVYHGAKRSHTYGDFSDYDFVLTTYSTIESDYRKYVMPPKEKCEYCGKKFNSNKMRIHLKYYCGPFARKTEKQSKQVSKKKKCLVKQKGSAVSVKNEKGGKKKNKKKAKTHDDALHLSSEEDVDDEKKGSEKPSEPLNDKRQSVLHSVRWERIILDEAHFIKDRRCNTARAVFALESQYKWALSGTPLQNRVGELYSLVRFLQIFPYSFYFCKDCDCKVLDYGASKDCVNCPHSFVRHFCWWNKYISNPIQCASMAPEGGRAMVLLRERLLKNIVLRRTKSGRAADLALPPKIVTLRRDSLDENEQEFYEALYTQSRVQFDSYVTAGTLMNNYAHIFDLLTRLRQAVDHPYLVIYSKTAELPDGIKDNDGMKNTCGLCHDPAEDIVVTSCKHAFCKACLIDYSASLGNASCPTCLKPLTVDLTTRNSGEKPSVPAIKGFKRSGILSRLNNITDFKTSTKIDALREEIRNMVESDGSAKGIVFSQFTSFLDLINFSLTRSGIKCVQLVGSMTLSEREKAIRAFTDDSDCKIFLMSLKAGGVALNLTVASHVFLMDPWWNPAVENQAQDRIHRIGQYKPIRSVRFVIEDTIEERILKLQEKKELVFQGTVGDSADAMAKLTADDLRFLFHT
ncbi:DNA repair protein RAD16 isoform X1 [Ananas comosus]|uniref:DNA repair protein RAD16 isoform X1 n=1 Tax=Ananas comosus TaxID=4615 RepID=A0A6P5FBA9_ANACO|nr:DNA repair protein RAD16 isoform X1 [Ananas comosus]